MLFVPYFTRSISTSTGNVKKLPSILRSIPNIEQILQSPTTPTPTPTPTTPPKKSTVTTTSKQDTPRTIIDADYLNRYFSKDSLIPITDLTKSQLTHINKLFNTSKIYIDWSIYDYTQIPGEEERLKLEERINDTAPVDQDDGEVVEFDKYETDVKQPLIKNNMKLGHIKFIENKNKKILNQEIQNNLPEIILLGRCNVGKSSLINCILSPTNLKLNNPKELARVKNYAGYTPCLNFYNIGGLFRLVDSPGYGVKGKEWQGELVFKYLMNRRVLKNCYLILDGKIGLNQYDEEIIKNLYELGIQFDIIFSKIDKLKQFNRLQHLIELIENQSILNQLKMKPRFYFVNSMINDNDLNYRSVVDLI
ncbi:hypothetical protein CANARDRAFT_8585 [[Candida] arabinofermentans NRRL YB-2248]|uniref:EngB-type G domain-containing protein n=1 Tax=[Candida] arabinofermentans NRRL YB-2248 TaxID=983967 RepID=A0A1E4SYR6_9ASCO|nr:hypothetical protein CANARDRAFT_8585 [[Candida] arabinofermentans NRRL YB-2248]